MDIDLLVKGLIIGFSIAAPVGPIGLLCIRRTLEHGQRVGFVSGLGAAAADGLYGLLAGLGLAAITQFLVDQQSWLQAAGGAFLCYLGVRTWLAKPAQASAQAKGEQMIAAFASTFFLTLTNPLTIFSFLAIFSGLGVSPAANGSFAALPLVLGVFGGSALWWWVLSQAAGLLKSRFQTLPLHWINRISGTILLLFGGWSLRHFLWWAFH